MRWTGSSLCARMIGGWVSCYRSSYNEAHLKPPGASFSNTSWPSQHWFMKGRIWQYHRTRNIPVKWASIGYKNVAKCTYSIHCDGRWWVLLLQYMGVLASLHSMGSSDMFHMPGCIVATKLFLFCSGNYVADIYETKNRPSHGRPSCK